MSLSCSPPPSSHDPNDAAGPVGYGPQGFITDSSVLPYRIDFENAPTATAPAQSVVVTDPLDPNIDWSTLQFTEVGFGSNMIAIPAGSQHFQTTVSMTYGGLTFDVLIELGLNLSTGVITATFQSIDPIDNLPPSLLIGFLPPEDGTGRGLGYFSYTAMPNAGLPTGTEIHNVATVRFDVNPPITTDQVNENDPSQGVDPSKQDLNTVDSVAPTSSVSTLPAFSPASVAVNWSGQDDPGGSGIDSYDIYVSDDGGEFSLWQYDTSATSATFTGVDGHTYGFYSAAFDNAGNAQPIPMDVQATTTVDAAPPTSSVSTLPEFSTATFHVEWSGSDGSGSGLTSYSVYVSDNGGDFTPWLIGTSQTSAAYTGVNGHTYGFYSIAIDAVGNQEQAPSTPQASTKVDTVAPTSTVSPLPTATASTSFLVAWSGSDDTGGSGIASYQVYDSDNGGPFVLFQNATTQTSATFTGQIGHTYGFYSVATDNVGNVQAIPTAAQATTFVAYALSGSPSTIVVNNGRSFSGVVGGFIDPNGAHSPSDYSATIDWGDGSGVDTHATIQAGGAANAFNVLGTHTYAAPGVFAVTIVVTSSTAPGATINSSANVLATVQGVQIDDGSAQRSMIRSLTVTFSGVVTLNGSQSFSLTNNTTHTTENLVVSSRVVNRNTVATLDFTGADIIATSLADGRYTLTVVGSQIIGPGGLKLDGASTGAAGSDRLDQFFRLFGDANGDGKVDNSDLIIFQSTNGKHIGDSGYLSYMDFNDDGVIDLTTDYAQFRRRFGHSI